MSAASKPAVPAARPLFALSLLTLLGVLWGGQTVLAKFVITSGVPPFGYAFWQTFGAGCVLLLFNLVRRKPPPGTLRHVLFYTAVGWTGSGIPTANMYVVLSEIPVGLMAIALTTVPLITYGLSLGVRLERFDVIRALGISAGFAGAMMILLPRGSLPDPTMLPFVALAFLTPFSYSISGVYASARRPADVDSMHVACGTLLAASMLLLPVSLATGTFYPIWQKLDFVNGLILAHIMTTAFSFFVYFSLLRLAGAVYFSQVTYIVTATAVTLGILFFAEVHSTWIWGALVVIIAGVSLVNLRQRAARRALTK